MKFIFNCLQLCIIQVKINCNWNALCMTPLWYQNVPRTDISKPQFSLNFLCRTNNKKTLMNYFITCHLRVCVSFSRYSNTIAQKIASNANGWCLWLCGILWQIIKIHKTLSMPRSRYNNSLVEKHVEYAIKITAYNYLRNVSNLDNFVYTRSCVKETL